MLLEIFALTGIGIYFAGAKNIPRISRVAGRITGRSIRFANDLKSRILETVENPQPSSSSSTTTTAGSQQDLNRVRMELQQGLMELNSIRYEMLNSFRVNSQLVQTPAVSSSSSENQNQNLVSPPPPPLPPSSTTQITPSSSFPTPQTNHPRTRSFADFFDEPNSQQQKKQQQQSNFEPIQQSFDVVFPTATTTPTTKKNYNPEKTYPFAYMDLSNFGQTEQQQQRSESNETSSTSSLLFLDKRFGGADHLSISILEKNYAEYQEQQLQKSVNLTTIPSQSSSSSSSKTTTTDRVENLNASHFVSANPKEIKPSIEIDSSSKRVKVSFSKEENK